MNEVLITGGAGAIGSHISKKLIDEGHNVTIIDNLTSGREFLVPKKARFIEGSILNHDKLGKAFDYKPSHVFHLAAFFANQNSVDNPEEDLAINGQGIINVLKLALKNKVKKLIYTSSSCVYGNKEVMKESDKLPEILDTPYAITKLLGEEYCKFWTQFHGLNTVILRLFNSYGPGEFPGKYRNVIPNFITTAMEGKSLTITGSGEETRDFNFVEDTADGIIKACFSNTKPGDVFNIAGGKETKIKNLVFKINQITGNKAPVIYKQRRSWDHVIRRFGCIEKSKKILKYKPKHTLDDGIEKTYRWLKENVHK